MTAKTERLADGTYKVSAKVEEQGIELTCSGVSSAQMWRILSSICPQIEVVNGKEEHA